MILYNTNSGTIIEKLDCLGNKTEINNDETIKEDEEEFEEILEEEKGKKVEEEFEKIY